MVHQVEHFYGVYLLYNVNPKFKGRTYIGFTVDPNRRVKQHNTGKHAGGAWRTSGKGPWPKLPDIDYVDREMVVITHGFPNEIMALRFEWAWQNPNKSRLLKHISGKSRKESAYDYRFRILSEMLRTAPWNRLALTVHWLIQSYQRDFPPDLTPPLHMGVAYGPVKAVKVKGAPSNRGKRKNADISDTDPELTDIDGYSDTQTDKQTSTNTPGGTCNLCGLHTNGRESVRCYQPDCKLISHMICLSRRFLKGDSNDHLVPVGGACPLCRQELLWGDVIRHKYGCYLKTSEQDPTQDHWANDLQTQIVL